MGNKAGLPRNGRSQLSCCLPPILLGLVAGCASARIPYDLARLPAAKSARHSHRVAVLPFVDEREAEEVGQEDGLFSYNGFDYHPTDLERLEHPPGMVIAELLAQHLVRTGSFREVVLVREAQDAPSAQLLLRGRISRARGYVEAEGQRGDREPPPRVRRVIAEVFLSDVELVEPGADGRRLLHADLGWSILEERPTEPTPPSAWQVLGDALFESHQQLATLLEDAVLDGSFVVEERIVLTPTTVRSSTAPLARLEAAVPEGWSFDPAAEGSAPLGWRAQASCESGRYSARQTQRFHRVLGPYQPTVRVWLCPAAHDLELDHRSEFPARYLGTTPSAEHAFIWRLGPSSWPGAEADLARVLSVTPPASKYVFRIHGAQSDRAQPAE